MGRLVLAVAGLVAAACGTLVLRRQFKKKSRANVPVHVKNGKRRRHVEALRFPDVTDAVENDHVAS